MDGKLVKRVAAAIDRVSHNMDRKRYLVPAHKREKYFGGYKERVLDAQAREVIRIVRECSDEH